jgi:hypothetical protein
MREPLLGPDQQFPQRCMDCLETLSHREPVTMLPWLREGDCLAFGRWPTLRVEDKLPRAGTGRLLWAVWLCLACARKPEWLPHVERAVLAAAAPPPADEQRKPRPIWPPVRVPPPEEDGEPDEVRRARMAAERAYSRSAIASTRQRRFPPSVPPPPPSTRRRS